MTDKELRILLSVYNALQYELGEFEKVIHENTDQGYFQDLGAYRIAVLVKNSPDYNPDHAYVREVTVDNKTRLISTDNPLSWIEQEFLGIVY